MAKRRESSRAVPSSSDQKSAGQLKVNGRLAPAGWIVFRGAMPVAAGASQREAIEEASRYVTDPAAGLMHLQPATADELAESRETIESGHPWPAGRTVIIRSVERLIQVAEEAGDVHTVDVLKDAVALLRQASGSSA